jgi:hypothetical protein
MNPRVLQTSWEGLLVMNTGLLQSPRKTIQQDHWDVTILASFLVTMQLVTPQSSLVQRCAITMDWTSLNPFEKVLNQLILLRSIYQKELIF